MKYFEFWIEDYVTATSDLTLSEHGAYLNLMLFYYGRKSAGGPLPADYKRLYQICSAISRLEQQAVRIIADRFFPIAEDGLRHNPKCDEILERANERIEKARGNAVKRWGFTDASSNASSIPREDARSHAPLDPIPINPKEEGEYISSHPEEFRLASLLHECILANDPKKRTPNWEAWTRDIDKLLRIDARSVQEVEKVIRWCQQDSFWKANILSPAKLRDKFTQLLLSSTRTNSNGKPKPPSISDSVASINRLGPSLEAIEKQHRERNDS